MGTPLCAAVHRRAAAKKFEQQKNEFGLLPQNTIFGIDKTGAIREEIATQMKLAQRNQLPIFIIADTFNRVVFLSQGYTIGLGEQLTKVIGKL